MTAIARCPSTDRRPRLLTPPVADGGLWVCPDCGIGWRPDQVRWNLNRSQAEALAQLYRRDQDAGAIVAYLYGGGNRTSTGPFRSTATLQALAGAGLAVREGSFSFSPYTITPLGRTVAASLVPS